MAIKKCVCRSLGQDKLHGYENRVMTPAGKSTVPVWKCTVCERTYPRKVS